MLKILQDITFAFNITFEHDYSKLEIGLEK